MPLLTWNNKYSVGVKAMDDEHTALVGILNELHAAMLKGQAQAVTGPLLNNLTEYARKHFASEEAMLESAKFPGLAQHREQHRALTGRLEELAARYKQGDITIFPQLLNFVRDWLTSHMQKEDKEYTPWMNEHGVR
jgi:hemerythrin